MELDTLYIYKGERPLGRSFCDIYSRLPGWRVLDKQEVFWRMLAPLPFASLFEERWLGLGRW